MAGFGFVAPKYVTPFPHMLGMGSQVRARLEEFIIELKVEMVGLEIHENKYGGHSSREFAERIVNVLSLVGNALPKSIIMNLGCGPNHLTVLPWAWGFRMEWSPRTKLAFTHGFNSSMHVKVVRRTIAFHNAFSDR